MYPKVSESYLLTGWQWYLHDVHQHKAVLPQLLHESYLRYTSVMLDFHQKARKQ